MCRGSSQGVFPRVCADIPKREKGTPTGRTKVNTDFVKTLLWILNVTRAVLQVNTNRKNRTHQEKHFLSPTGQSPRV